MKTISRKFLLVAVFGLFLSGLTTVTNAQSKTLFYWSFDNFNSGLSTQGNPSLMKPIYATWASTDTSKGYISDVTVPGTSKYYLAYWDNYPIAEAGDTFNVQYGGLSGTATGNLALRLRNPNDSMQLLITAPTTHYKNIAIKFDVFKSGSGPVKDLFDYSTDGGTTWVTTGLSIPSDSPSATNWIPVTVKITNTAAENNPKFIFRLKTTPPNAILNGNDRFDNFSIAGDSIGGSTPPPPSQTVMYYWNFDHFVGLTAAGSPSLILPVHSNWSTLDSTKGLLSYIPAYTVSSKYATYWDVVAGEASDTFNVKKGGKSGLTFGNNELRFRNPSDSMEALISVPTTRYKNITIKYGLERTASGQGAENFDYSTNGGNTWKTSGLSITHDTALTVFSLVTVNLSADTTVNNNPNGFIFRIKFTTPNSTTSGNNRFDNLSVEGDTDKIVTPPPPPSQKVIYYWDFDNFAGLSGAGSPSLILPIHSNWSTLDSTKGLLSYVPAFAVSTKYATYWDVVAGEASDTFNLKKGGKSGLATGNNELRFRNPSDSMEALITVPTTHYKNITIKYALERTASGQGAENFDYSTNGGTSWKTSGLSIKHDTALTVFSLVSVNLATDTTVNNNPNGFIFRIKFTTPNSTTSGNNRVDNLSIEGDTDVIKTVGPPPPPGQKLIHYFNFNNLVGLSAAGSPSLITPIQANWSSLDSTKALISYTPAYAVSSNYQTYWDTYPMTPADSNVNAQRGAPAGNALRVRNPSDSMQLEFALPTTHYKNITLKYACEKSSLGSGQAKQVFDYSINGGVNWKTSGLSIKSDSITNVIFNLITVSLATDTMINNNPNFIFRIKFVGQNSGTSGNNRFDNVTLQGDTDKAITTNQFSGIEIEQPASEMNCSLYPNPTQNQVTVSTGSENAKTISVTSIEGKLIYTSVSNEMNVHMDISSLKSGIYILNVIENQTGKTAYLRLVKN